MGDVRLVDLEMFKRYSLAIRQEAAPAEEVLAVLDATRRQVEAVAGPSFRSQPAPAWGEPERLPRDLGAGGEADAGLDDEDDDDEFDHDAEDGSERGFEDATEPEPAPRATARTALRPVPEPEPEDEPDEHDAWRPPPARAPRTSRPERLARTSRPARPVRERQPQPEPDPDPEPEPAAGDLGAGPGEDATPASPARRRVRKATTTGPARPPRRGGAG